MDGHTITVAEDGLDALDRLGQARYDLLLTDIVMPGLDGIALALKAGAEWPEMRILLMSGYAAERQRAHNLEALVHRVIPKPFSLADIRKAVQERSEERRVGKSVSVRVDLGGRRSHENKTKNNKRDVN